MNESQWHFDPYHQRIDEAMVAHPEAPPVDTEFPVWEVFQRQRRGDAFLHVGAVHANDPEMALLMAREQFARRGRCVQLWVVPSRAIVATPLDAEELLTPSTDKSYREAAGYRLAARKRRLVEEAAEE